jgi:hypothetical protein
MRCTAAISRDSPALERLERALDDRRLGELPHADGNDLGGRHPQRHLVLDEADDEQLELGACDLLLLDRNDLAHAMGGVHHELAGLEALPLGRLFNGHSGSCSFVVRFLPTRVRFAPDTCHGRRARGSAGRLRGPPPGGGFLGPPRGGSLFPPGYGGGFLRLMTRFSGHDTCVGLTPLFEWFLEQSPKIRLPDGERQIGGFSRFKLYSTISVKIKALPPCKTGFQAYAADNLLTGG